MDQTAINAIDFLQVNELATNKYKKSYKGFIQYGTAGFRTKSSRLNHVLFRMGLLTVIRSQFKKATIGIMITASHNPEEDNGIKLVDPSGEMIDLSWENIATNLANVEDEEVSVTLQSIIKEQNIDINFVSSIIIGRDTRDSSLPLANAAIAGIKALKGNFKNFEIVTTPQLHYLVVCKNTNGVYGIPTLEGYYEKISEAFKTIVDNKIENNKYVARLQLDAANGVGALAAKEFKKRLAKVLNIKIYNNGEGKLNHMCGADYVKMYQVLPLNLPCKPFTRCVSIDGDADRIVYYFTDEQNKFYLLDGDRISILIASYLIKLIKESKLDLQLGLVQTAYANGGSTEYITNILKVPVACVPTGVKHLHHKALEYDAGVYFEANGHGSVVFKNSAIKLINDAADNKSLSENERIAAITLSRVIAVINQTVGDALSDMLLVELILKAKGWDVLEWQNSYKDIPNKQVKVEVKDKSIITTTNAGRECVTPKGLQKKINEIVSKYEKGRSFVRPSGTEDVVRVYAECNMESDIEKLTAEVSLAVYELANGVGTKPVLP